MSIIHRARRLGGTVLAVAALALGAVVAAPTAQAASYNGACGSGYVARDHIDIWSPATAGPDAPLAHLGTVWLTYNSSTGKNCTVTIREHPNSTKIFIYTWLCISGTDKCADQGNYFTTFAGPVFLSAAHKCIDWGGSIDGPITDQSVERYHEHCG